MIQANSDMLRSNKVRDVIDVFDHSFSSRVIFSVDNRAPSTDTDYTSCLCAGLDLVICDISRMIEDPFSIGM